MSQTVDNINSEDINIHLEDGINHDYESDDHSLNNVISVSQSSSDTEIDADLPQRMKRQSSESKRNSDHSSFRPKSPSRNSQSSPKHNFDIETINEDHFQVDEKQSNQNVDSSDIISTNDKSSTFCCKCCKCCSCWFLVEKKALEFYKSIQFPKYFILFNVICIVQAIPAITYYILFYQSGFYLFDSSGMAPVWATTIGSICTTIVGSALAPVPDGLLTKPFCVAVIIWEFAIMLFTFIAAITLGILGDYHGMIWSIVCFFSSGYAGYFLAWFAFYLQHKDLYASESNSKLTSSLSNLEDTILESNAVQLKPLHPTELTTYSDMRKRSATTDGIDSISIPTSRNSRTQSDTNDTSQMDETSSAASNNQLLDKTKESTLSDAQTHGNDTQTDPTKPPSCVNWSAIKMGLIHAFLWLVLLVFYLIPIGFGINSAMVANESRLYPAPGQVYRTFTTTSVGSTPLLPMHLYCTGVKNHSRPTIVFEADGNLTGFSFYNMQSKLSSSTNGNWRVCSYDRAGFGWSNISPLGTNTPSNTAARLKQLLVQSNETRFADDEAIDYDDDPHGSPVSQSLILIGYGDGVVMMQIFAAKHSKNVAGFVLLDGYPNLYVMEGRSSYQIYGIIQKECGTLQIARAMETAAFMRPVTDYSTDQQREDGVLFEPNDELNRYLSTFTNGKYWATMYNNICVDTTQLTGYTDYLTNFAKGLKNSTLYATGVHGTAWPTFSAGIPILIVVASETIYEGVNPQLYYHQAIAYNRTLSQSNSTTFIICQGCYHSFAYDSNSDWLATQIENYLHKHF